MNKTIFASVIALGAAISVSAEDYYVKELVFPAGTDSLTKIEMAGRVVPNEQQKAWQERELTAFIHFGMNTFTDREWGDGTESPELFNPTNLDTDQWVKVLKDAGFEMVILTAKHHDGFCLWPTATTTHSVAASPWRDGKGDVVADLRRSCDKYGMKLGLYLSPWDRNAACYGDSPRYNDMFVAQLTELLTNYGKVDEVWFDGACAEGPNGKKQEYDWLRFRETMRRLQPEAVLAITGDDVRWVGNEGGRGRETEWSVSPLVPSIFNFADSVNNSLGIDAMSSLIGDRSTVAASDRLYWWPSEVDVSIRPGWFYHDDQQPHSLQRMAEIYLQSVGRNSVLLLNIPPDRRGLIADVDANRILELRKWIDANFTDNKLGKSGSTITAVVLEEDIARGQRVEKFDVEGLIDGQWKVITSGTTIGKKRILTFAPVAPADLRLVVKSSRGPANAELTGAYFVTMPNNEAASVAKYPNAPTPTRSMALSMGGNIDLVYFRYDTPQDVAGFVYTPTVKDGCGYMYRYTVMMSNDCNVWEEVETIGEFGNILANPIPQQVIFKQPVKAAYIAVVCTETIGGKFTPNATEVTLLAPAN